jgi:hypothetical protein
MADRKVLVNYVHPDIDPSLLGRRKKPKVEKNGKIEVRTMLPFNLQCDACKNYMYAGKKFNGKKEVVQGETYMGVKILRFYIKCTTCSASITFKTDPQNSGYTCEFGASRNFEGWREDQVNAAEEREQAKIEEEKDAMTKLESKTLNNQAEMDEMDALEEIHAINQRNERVDTDRLIKRLRGDDNDSGNGDGSGRGGQEGYAVQQTVLLSNGLTAADEALVQSVRFKNKNNSSSSSSSSRGGGGGKLVEHADSDSERGDSDGDDEDAAKTGSLVHTSSSSSNSGSSGGGSSGGGSSALLSGVGVVMRKVKKRKHEEAAAGSAAPPVVSALAAYGSDSD